VESAAAVVWWQVTAGIVRRPRGITGSAFWRPGPVASVPGVEWKPPGAPAPLDTRARAPRALGCRAAPVPRGGFHSTPGTEATGRLRPFDIVSSRAFETTPRAARRRDTALPRHRHREHRRQRRGRCPPRRRASCASRRTGIGSCSRPAGSRQAGSRRSGSRWRRAS